MTECVHVLGQGFNIAHMEHYVWCIHCKKRWSKSEVEGAINATDKLSANSAKEWVVIVEEETGMIMSDVQAYADMRDEK